MNSPTKKQAISIIAATAIVFLMININAKALKYRYQIADTVVVLKLSDYRRLYNIGAQSLQPNINDAQRTLNALDLRDIDKRVRVVVDTGRLVR